MGTPRLRRQLQEKLKLRFELEALGGHKLLDILEGLVGGQVDPLKLSVPITVEHQVGVVARDVLRTRTAKQRHACARALAISVCSP